MLFLYRLYMLHYRFLSHMKRSHIASHGKFLCFIPFRRPYHTDPKDGRSCEGGDHNFTRNDSDRET